MSAGQPWRLIGTLIASRPVSPIAARVYRTVAKNRHKMPGGTDSCALP
jgi:predicted DCC family thiol-disulfide oxidoreductase YuxK